MSEKKEKKYDDGSTIESRVVSCTGSINFREYKHSDLPSLLQVLEGNLKNAKYVENYYLIAHYDSDTPHIHYIIEFTGSVRLKTMLNNFERMGYNREAVNIKKLGFLNAMIKYFLHLTEDSKEEGKEEYKLDCIISSMPYEYLENLLLLDDDELNVDRLVEVCLECDGHIVKIMKTLGLKLYHKWRFEIKEILNYEYALRYVRDEERKRREEEKINELPF